MKVAQTRSRAELKRHYVNTMVPTRIAPAGWYGGSSRLRMMVNIPGTGTTSLSCPTTTERHGRC
jgi:hypothetical protein